MIAWLLIVYLHNCMIISPYLCHIARLHNRILAKLNIWQIVTLPNWIFAQLDIWQIGYLPGWRGVLRGVRGGEGWLSTPQPTPPSGWCCSGSPLSFDFYIISISSDIVDIRLGEWQCEFFPPNCSMLSFTHCRAISWSNIPENYSNHLFCQILVQGDPKRVKLPALPGTIFVFILLYPFGNTDDFTLPALPGTSSVSK